MNKTNDIISAIKGARENAKILEATVIRQPITNPKDLRIDDVIYGIVLTPVTDGKNLDDNSVRKTVGIVERTVELIDGRKKNADNYIINGDIEMPKQGGTLVPIEKAFFSDLEVAKAVAKELVAYELELAEKQAEELEKEIDFLTTQLKENRF